MDVVEQLDEYVAMMDASGELGPYNLLVRAAATIREVRAEIARMKQERDYEC